MDERTEALIEAARRGLLPPDMLAAYNEAAKQGLLQNINPGFSLDAETGKDILKAAPGALATGAVYGSTAIPDVADLLSKGIGYFGDKAVDYISPMLPESVKSAVGPKPFANMAEAQKKYDADKSGIIPKLPMPTSENAMKGVEALNGGKFYQAQTPVGKIVQSGLEAAPSAMAFGGSNLPASLFKGFTSGAGSEAAGQAAENLGYGGGATEGAARVAGSFAGPGAVAGLRRAATPFPVTNPTYAQAVQHLDQYGLPMTAARRTGSPGLASFETNTEARAPFRATPDAERQAFTRTLMQSTGSTANNPALPATRPGANNALHEQRNNLQGNLDNWFGTHASTWNPATFEPQLRAHDTAYRNAAGSTASDAVRDSINDIVYGLAGTPPAPGARSVVAGMTGQRYQYLKDRIDQRIDSASSASERNALINVKQTMEQQLNNSVPPAARDELANLNRQYANYKTIAGSKVPPTGDLDPSAIVSSNAKRVGREGANLGQGSEAGRLAQSAERIYTPKQDLSDNTPKGESVLGALGGALAGWKAGLGADATLVASILGGGTGYGLKHAAAHNPITSGVYYNPLTQGYLSNQRFMPGPATMADPALVAKVLAASPEREKLLPQPQE